MQRIIFIIILLLCISCNKTYANEIITDQINNIDFNQIQNEIDKNNQKFDFKNEVKKLISGETKIGFEDVLRSLVDLILMELKENFWMVGQLLLLIILSAVIKNLTDSFQNKEAGEISFYVCYIIMIITMLKAYRITLDIAVNAIDNIMNLMKLVIPIFISALVSSGHITTATMYDGLVFVGINYAAIIVKNILLPITAYLCVIQIINLLTEKQVLTEFNDLIKKTIGFSLKTIIALFFGVSTIQRFTAPVIDNIAKKGVALTTKTVVPVLGDVMNSAVDTFLNCMTLVKNSVGIIGIITIIIVSVIPLVKMLSILVIYKIAAAIMQPISDKRVVKCFSEFSSNVAIIFSSLITVILIFVISVGLLISI